MSVDLKSIKTKISRLWIYSLSFIVLFDFIFLRTFSDSGQTFGMFILVSFVLQVVTLFLFILTTLGLQHFQIRQNIFVNSFLLFLISEISIFLVTRDISLFGFFETHNLNLSTDLDNSLMKFHKGRDFALSMSGLLSCVIYLVFSLFRQRRQLPPTKGLPQGWRT